MFSPDACEIDSVTQNNLKTLSVRQSVLSEQMICELAEIASLLSGRISEMLSQGYGIYEALSIASDFSHSDFATVCESMLPENEERVKRTFASVDFSMKAVFSELLLEELNKRKIILSESDFLTTAKGNRLIAYVRNPLADEAYDVLSEGIDSARVKYFKNMRDAVASVVSGECEYCLLPLEERGGVRLFAVSGLIFGEDLKISSVTPVFGYDGLADMKYALVSKHFDIPEILPSDDGYFEIRFSSADEGMTLADMLAGARIFGISVYRINTLSFASELDTSDKYSVVFRSEGGNFTAFLIYLTLFCDTYIPVGIYKNLE